METVRFLVLASVTVEPAVSYTSCAFPFVFVEIERDALEVVAYFQREKLGTAQVHSRVIAHQHVVPHSRGAGTQALTSGTPCDLGRLHGN